MAGVKDSPLKCAPTFVYVSARPAAVKRSGERFVCRLTPDDCGDCGDGRGRTIELIAAVFRPSLDLQCWDLQALDLQCLDLKSLDL
ncbi:hypothetical protein HAZT_HAZT011934 [Hyalella azteca]|uniref:Uncharacterized protein n=1 Tax=Hyalella azteca TaxID=294128 RepID=A0A6A0GR21_HYAAZ|nr:hypothetical protein HAZT_HAZT011934 [Hyalella azteca]